MNALPANSPSFAEALRFWAWLGVVSFGGPGAQIAIMRDELVDRRRWVGEAEFARGLAVATTLPGPEAHQLAVYLGWRLNGVPGGLAAGALFVLPAVGLLMLLSWVYAAWGKLAAIDGAVYGMRAVVVALIAQAAVRLATRAIKGWGAMAVAAGAMGATLAGVPFPIVVGACFVLGAAVFRGDSTAAPSDERPPRKVWPAVATAAVLVVAWLTPVVLAGVLLGRESRLAQVGEFFSKASLVTFGGAYAVLAYVGQHAVGGAGGLQWLTYEQMASGLALAETTPGPLIIVLQFVGFMAGWNAPPAGWSPVWGGLVGGALASWATFVPAVAMMMLAAPFVSAITRVRWLAAAMRGVVAAAVGVIASLALVLGTHAAWVGGRIDWIALAIITAAAVALFRFKVGMVTLIGGGALVGIAIRLLG